MTVIHFYRAGDAYGFFSNFSRHPVTLKGKVWPTSEHYFQAQKFPDTHHEEEIRNAPGPGEAARMGRQRSRPLRPDWEQVKDDIMREVVRAKFTQHEELKRALLDTGDAELVEHTTNDAYWADGGDGSGVNMLGKILMEIREELRR
ncbi:NADAR family protein [Sorangium cellulosum]|uniref:NADAR family protein n=1 Tax=Sorangium TaxID=39643 RepID=UPI003D9C450A